MNLHQHFGLDSESLGAYYKGRHTGTFGEFGVFSFNGNKIITTSGGGMLVSDDEEKIKKVRFWSTQSRDAARHYQHSELGFNYRMSNVVAGIGRGQLKVLEQRVAKKKYIFEFYRRELGQLEGVDFMPINDWNEPNYWLSVMTLKGNVRSLDVMEALEKENIESRPVWKPMQMQPMPEHEPAKHPAGSFAHFLALAFWCGFCRFLPTFGRLNCPFPIFQGLFRKPYVVFMVRSLFAKQVKLLKGSEKLIALVDKRNHG